MAWILRLQLDTGYLDLVSAALWDAGTTGVAHLDADPSGTTLLAGFETEREASAAAAALRQWVTPDAATIEPVDEGAWADPGRRTTATVAGHQITLAPAAAFGDGQHPSTRLALDLLADAMGPDVASGGLGDDHGGPGHPPAPAATTCIDFGAGTGILTLAALAHGARHVVAIENDPAALDALRATLAHNPGLTADRTVEVATALLPSAPGPSTAAGGADADPNPTEAATATEALVAAVTAAGVDESTVDVAGVEVGTVDESTVAESTVEVGLVDVVMVNVLLPVHQAWGRRLSRHRAEDGVVVTAGVLIEQEASLLACYRGLTVRHRRTDGDWLGLVLA